LKKAEPSLYLSEDAISAREERFGRPVQAAENISTNSTAADGFQGPAAIKSWVKVTEWAA
jgi:hypothetical protein